MHPFSSRLRHADKQATTHQSVTLPLSAHFLILGVKGRTFQSINSLNCPVPCRYPCLGGSNRSNMPAGDNDLGTGMSGKWFSNRGQIGQLVVAILALLLGLSIAWPQLSPHMDLLSLWPLVAVPLAAFIVFRLGRLSKSTEPTPQPPATLTSFVAPAAQPPERNLPSQNPFEISERFALDDDSVLLEKKTIKLGDYWEIREGMSRLKVTPMAFRDGDKGRPYVELKIDTGGSVFYGGDMAIESQVNRIALPETSSGFQAEEFCAYQFSFSERHVHFIAFRVDHINKFSNEVVLEACAVALRKTARI